MRGENCHGLGKREKRGERRKKEVRGSCFVTGEMRRSRLCDVNKCYTELYRKGKYWAVELTLFDDGRTSEKESDGSRRTSRAATL